MHHDEQKINISYNCSWICKSYRKHIKEIYFPKMTSFKKDINKNLLINNKFIKCAHFKKPCDGYGFEPISS